MAARPPALHVRDLHVRLHRGGAVNHALRGIDLTVAPGEIVALVGESGSGKSTLALALQGLLPAESAPQLTGSIEVGGVEVVGGTGGQLRRVRRESVGSVFQDPMTSLNPTMRIGAQLAEAITDGGDPVEHLARVGIPDPEHRSRAYPHQLSGGQRQRVMIAMAMARQPVLVVADEPTTALDVTVQARILETFRRLRDESGTAFLFVTHDLAVAAATADRIVVLYAGLVAEQGAVREVTTAPAHPYTAALLDARFELDVDKGHQLPTLPGEPPSPGDPVDACPFANRCILVVDDCRQQVPPLEPVTQHDGAAACLRSDDVRLDLWQRTARPWPPRLELLSSPGDPAKDMLVVEGRGLRMVYPARGRGGRVVEALRGVDLVVADGESVALVGESGSGKSTLLRMVAGLVKPTSGTLDVRSSVRPQLVYQDASASLTPWMTVGELVGERLRPERLSKQDRATKVGEALERVGLPARLAAFRPAQLSGGQRQRVAVARAVVVPPRLLLCDEPVSAMDVSLAAAILNLLESLRRELGMAMLFVTHDLAAARFATDRIVVMQSGAVVEEGPADQLVNEPQAAYTKELLASMPSFVTMGA